MLVKKKWGRLVALVLTGLMLFGLIPVGTLADEEAPAEEAVVEVAEAPVVEGEVLDEVIAPEVNLLEVRAEAPDPVEEPMVLPELEATPDTVAVAPEQALEEMPVAKAEASVPEGTASGDKTPAAEASKSTTQAAAASDTTAPAEKASVVAEEPVEEEAVLQEAPVLLALEEVPVVKLLAEAPVVQALVETAVDSLTIGGVDLFTETVEGASFDPDTNTLALDGLAQSNSIIRIVMKSAVETPINIILKGVNAISQLLVDGNARIAGDGRLDAYVQDKAYAIQATNLTIDSGTINATVMRNDRTDNSAIAISADKNLVVNGGDIQCSASNLNQIANNYGSAGMYADGQVIINGGKIEAYCEAPRAWAEGICGWNGITINDGTVLAEGKSGDEGVSVGLYSGVGTIAINGGTVQAWGTGGIANSILAGEDIVLGDKIILPEGWQIVEKNVRQDEFSAAALNPVTLSDTPNPEPPVPPSPDPVVDPEATVLPEQTDAAAQPTVVAAAYSSQSTPVKSSGITSPATGLEQDWEGLLLAALCLGVVAVLGGIIFRRCHR